MQPNTDGLCSKTRFAVGSSHVRDVFSAPTELAVSSHPSELSTRGLGQGMTTTGLRSWVAPKTRRRRGDKPPWPGKIPRCVVKWGTWMSRHDGD